MNEMNRAWQGYLRKDGRLGIRNRVLVVYTVKCAEFVAQRIVAESASPDVEAVGFDGCTDNQYAVNLLREYIRKKLSTISVITVIDKCPEFRFEMLYITANSRGMIQDVADPISFLCDINEVVHLISAEYLISSISGESYGHIIGCQFRYQHRRQL